MSVEGLVADGAQVYSELVYDNVFNAIVKLQSLKYM